MASTTTSSTGAEALSEEIDCLLEHYLELLDQYTTLRTQLSSVQSSIHQNIARANFTADRGIRYGQDCYDERMQATTLCHVTVVPEAAENNTPTMNISTEVFTVSTVHSGEDTGGEQENKPRKDPIRMFGILTPQALRVAQSESNKMVEDIIPKLASINAEMKNVEIQIRRKRKHKGKAEALEARTGVGGLEKGAAVECPG